MSLRPLYLAAACLLTLSTSQSFADAPNVLTLHGAHVQRMRRAVQQRPDDYKEALEQIRCDADAALEAGPWSVMDKPLTPPSGDKHDYYSVGPYWWPDPSKADGLPYIRRDGEVNPERANYDNVGMGRMTSAVRDLALGWYFTGDERYASHAAGLLRTWFLDPATRMNPNLEFGQAIPGRVAGRGIGIIDTVGLIDLADAIGLLQTSSAWTAADHRELQGWFRAYLHWLRTSDHGQDEANTSNNHAVWYDAQVVCFALFAGEESTAREVLQRAGPDRIATQIEPDGRMPLELARTKSFHYTLYNLRAFVALALLADHTGIDLWSYRTEDGRSIEAALDWFAPYVAGEQPWTYQQISRVTPSRGASLYLRTLEVLDKPLYRKIAATEPDPVTRFLWPTSRAAKD